MVLQVLQKTLHWVRNSIAFLAFDLRSDSLCQVFEMRSGIQFWDVWEVAFRISRGGCSAFSYLLSSKNDEGYAI